jgi:ATP-dependent helicase/nuclease subunit A
MSFDQDAALDTDRHVVVEACAGSGKTWLLASRIVRALLEGTPPREIVALTFTNKAAAEMRNRVVSFLREISHADSGARRARLIELGFRAEGLEAAMERSPAAFAAFLADPQPPVISTFHSWYARLAAMAPLSIAGWATRVMSPQPWDLLQRAWRLFFEREVVSLPYRELLQHHGHAAIRQAVEQWVKARAEWHALADAAARPACPRDHWRVLFEQVEQQSQRDIQAFYVVQADRASIFAEAFRGLPGRDDLQTIFERWDASEFDALRRSFLSPVSTDEPLSEGSARFRFRRGRQFIRRDDRKHWASFKVDVASELTGFLADINALLDIVDARLARARTQALWACGERLAKCLDDVMAATHEIDFTGLECMAWELMAGEASAAFHARLDQRVRHLLVDEFQDTNPVQWAMLRSWLSQYDQDDLSVREQAPRVFVVGDPKQSIYGFRRADPRVFRAATSWLVERFGASALRTNLTRRCGREIVDFLNRAMPALDSAGRYAPHDTLADRKPGAVWRLPLAASKSEEGDWIARALLRIRGQHPDIPWSSMRVILRTRTHMAQLEQSFARAGIPFVSDRPGGLLDTPEVRDVMALLRFLSAPWSDRDCAQVLRSPLLDMPEEVLVDLLFAVDPVSSPTPADRLAEMELPTRAARMTLFSRLSNSAAHSGAPPPLVHAAQELSRWLGWADRLPVHDLLHRVFSSPDVLARFVARFGGGRGVQCLANLEAFTELALDLDTGRFPSLSRFIRELERWARADVSEAPSLGSLPAAQAVRISSIHGVKGLEADVVVMAGLLDREMSDSGLQWLVHWSEGRDAILGVDAWSRHDPPTAATVKARHDHACQANDENFNLLYVGITRARRVLLLSATARGSDASREAGDEQLDATGDTRPSGWYRELAGHCDLLDVSGDSGMLSGDDGAAPRDWWASIEPAGQCAGQRPPEAGSGLAISPETRVETLAIRRGKALHRLLEHGDCRSPVAVDLLLAEFALPSAARREVVEAADLIHRTPRTALYLDNRLLSFRESEWPGVPGESSPVVRPDRVVRLSSAPEVWCVVDFKWQVLPSQEKAYADQLASYAGVFRSRRPAAEIRALIITARAEVWELIAGRLVHSC